MAKSREEMSSVERIAIDKRNRMGQIEAEYLRAKEYSKGMQFGTDKLQALDKIKEVLRQGLMQEAEALQMIGRVQQILLDTYQHQDLINEYEGLRKSLAEQYPQK